MIDSLYSACKLTKVPVYSNKVRMNKRWKGLGMVRDSGQVAILLTSTTSAHNLLTHNKATRRLYWISWFYEFTTVFI